VSERDLEYAADAIEGAGYTRFVDRVAEAYDVERGNIVPTSLKTLRGPEVGLLLALRVITYERGRAKLTSFGWSVATRLDVRKAQRKSAAQGPGWWRSR